jgi:hypothetical protein
VIFAIELHEEQHFVVAIGAPDAGDVDDQHLAAEPFVRVRHELAIQVREAETQRPVRSFMLVNRDGSDGSGKPSPAPHRTDRGERIVFVLHHWSVPSAFGVS